MGGFFFHLFSSSSLFSLGLYNLIYTSRNFLKSPHSYSAKPFHPFHSSSSNRLRFLPLYLIILFLFIAFLHQAIISADPDPLLKGRTPVHIFTSLQSAAVLFLFLLLSTALLVSESTSFLPIPSDLFFALASAIFFLNYSVSTASASVQTSDLQAKCESVSARISALSSILCLALACQSRLFVADLGLSASICLQGLWELQSGLSLYVEAFIPEGCHKLLDVVSGVESSTKCELDESKLRAVAVLDLAFVIHVMVVIFIVVVTYVVVAKSIGVRRNGGSSSSSASYEASPTSTVNVAGDSNLNSNSNHHNHIQMKALAGTQA